MISIRQYIKEIICLRNAAAVLVFFALSLFMPLKVSADNFGVNVCFYSSETNVNNYKSLKIEFDRYFSEKGSYEFHPFADRTVFERDLIKGNNQILILSSWHYRIISEEYGLEPVLIGVQNGKSYQNWIVVTCSQPNELKAVSPILATASSRQHTKSVVKNMDFEEKLIADSLKILAVPKDIDALTAVGFGMSEFALSTESSFNDFKALNPMLHKRMKVAARGSETLLLIVAKRKEFIQGAEKVIKIVQDMPFSENGRRPIKMIGIDKWKKVGLSDRAMLGRCAQK